jgi:hypothetical protein
VSYVLELRVNVQKRFAALSVHVQEALLDLLDQLAATAAPESMTAPESVEHHLLTYEGDSAWYQIVFSVRLNHVSRKLTVFDLWYRAKI